MSYQAGQQISYPASVPVGLGGGPAVVVAHSHPPKRVWTPNRGVILASAVLAIAATVLFVVALCTSYWLSTSNPAQFNLSEHWGLWRGCTSNDLSGSVCTTYLTGDCGLNPNVNPTSAKCMEFVVAKSFAIIGAVTAGLAAIFLFVMLIVDSYERCGPGLGVITFLTILLSAASGIITMVLYIELANNRVQNDDYHYDYSFGLFVGGWGLMFIIGCISCLCGAACSGGAAQRSSVSY